MVREEQVGAGVERLVDRGRDRVDREVDPAHRLRGVAAHEADGVPRLRRARRVATVDGGHDVTESDARVVLTPREPTQRATRVRTHVSWQPGNTGA